MKIQNPEQDSDNVCTYHDFSQTGHNKPDNRPHLDTRENQEPEWKSYDLTHNEEETKESASYYEENY